ncbi:MAG TPA: HPr family phosphocarrier protein [Caproiciproducens sp.]|nr:HPr family phosphocarrier protein [Caproiciproducens sp.]
MQRFEYVVKDQLGLHARPAGLLVKCVSACSSEVNLTAHDKTVSAKKLFGIMGLCIKMNDRITFTVTGAQEEADCAKIKQFCEQNL